MITDKQLVDTFLQNRSEEAFKDLYRAKSPGLYQFALRLCKHEELANELLQETWVKAIQNLPNFQWKSSLRTWLTGILINTERELLRKRQRSRNQITVREENIAINHTDTKIDLENAIADLPRGYRRVVLLHDVEGYTHKEIAQILGVSEGTSKSQLFQARKRLRLILKAYNYK